MPKSPLGAPEPLTEQHITGAFNSQAQELDEWLHKYALVNHKSGNARVFVATRQDRVIGYYALATAGVEKADAPSNIQQGGAPRQIPCLILARLAVDTSEQGCGIGRALLTDAIRRAVRVSVDVGVRALLIHTRDEQARSFYAHQAEFIQSPSDDLHLFLSLKQARQFVAR